MNTIVFGFSFSTLALVFGLAFIEVFAAATAHGKETEVLDLGTTTIQSTIRRSQSEIVENPEYLKKRVVDQLVLEFSDLEEDTLNQCEAQK